METIQQELLFLQPELLLKHPRAKEKGYKELKMSQAELLL